jgi:hypothetical protein
MTIADINRNHLLELSLKCFIFMSKILHKLVIDAPIIYLKVIFVSVPGIKAEIQQPQFFHGKVPVKD